VNWLLVAQIAVPLVGALVLLAVPLSDDAAARAGTVVAAVTLALAGVATWQAAPFDEPGPGLELDAPWMPALGMRAHLGLDGISAPLVLLTALLGVLVCAHLVRVRPEAGRIRGLVACVLVVVGGAIATFTALDLLLFFIAFETVLIPMWFVIAIWGDDRQPGVRALSRPAGEAARSDAAYRFVLYTALGSAVMLLGIILVVLRAGTSDLVVLADRAGRDMPDGVQLTAAVLIVVGLAVKAPMFPFHTWLPPAHTIAPTGGSVLLAGVLLKLGTYGLVRVAVPVLPDGMRQLAPWLAALGVAGILWGGLACLVERDLKRVVAMSSVAHMGFVLLGVAAMTPQGLQGALYANIGHGVVSALLFFVVGALKDRHHSADIVVIGTGIRDRLPRLGWLLALGAIAGLGLPGLAVFWGELLSVAGTWASGGPDGALGDAARPLAVLAVIGTAIAAAYWLRVLYAVWHGPPEPRWTGGTGVIRTVTMGDATTHETATTAPLVLATVALGLVPGPLLAATAPAVGALLGLPGGAG
jgi:NADH-quinone oxidoreductase subunit M